MDNVFVKINYRENSIDSNDAKLIKSGINYISNKGATKYLIGGGFYNKKSGSFMFKAKSMEEARKIIDINSNGKDMKLKYDIMLL